MNNVTLILEGYIYKYGDPIGNKLLDQGPKYTKDNINELIGDNTKRIRYPVIFDGSGSFSDPDNVIGHADVIATEKGLWAIVRLNDTYHGRGLRFASRSSILESFGLGFYSVVNSNGGFKIRAIMLVKKNESFHDIAIVYNMLRDEEARFILEERYNKRIAVAFNALDMSTTYRIYDSDIKNKLSELKIYSEDSGSMKPLIDELEKLDEEERRALEEM